MAVRPCLRIGRLIHICRHLYQYYFVHPDPLRLFRDCKSLHIFCGVAVSGSLWKRTKEKQGSDRPSAAETDLLTLLRMTYQITQRTGICPCSCYRSSSIVALLSPAFSELFLLLRLAPLLCFNILYSSCLCCVCPW